MEEVEVAHVGLATIGGTGHHVGGCGGPFRLVRSCEYAVMCLCVICNPWDCDFGRNVCMCVSVFVCVCALTKRLSSCSFPRGSSSRANTVTRYLRVRVCVGVGVVKCVYLCLCKRVAYCRILSPRNSRRSNTRPWCSHVLRGKAGRGACARVCAHARVHRAYACCMCVRAVYV